MKSLLKSRWVKFFIVVLIFGPIMYYGSAYLPTVKPEPIKTIIWQDIKPVPQKFIDKNIVDAYPVRGISRFVLEIPIDIKVNWRISDFEILVDGRIISKDEVDLTKHGKGKDSPEYFQVRWVEIIGGKRVYELKGSKIEIRIYRV